MPQLIPLSSRSRHASYPQCQISTFTLSNSYHTHLVSTPFPTCDNPLSLSHLADADHVCACSGRQPLRPVLRDRFRLSFFTTYVCMYPVSPRHNSSLTIPNCRCWSRLAPFRSALPALREWFLGAVMPRSGLSFLPVAASLPRLVVIVLGHYRQVYAFINVSTPSQLTLLCLFA